MRNVGTVVRGIRTPIIKENDNLEDIVIESLMRAKDEEGFEYPLIDEIKCVHCYQCINVCPIKAMKED